MILLLPSVYVANSFVFIEGTYVTEFFQGILKNSKNNDLFNLFE